MHVKFSARCFYFGLVTMLFSQAIICTRLEASGFKDTVGKVFIIGFLQYDSLFNCDYKTIDVPTHNASNVKLALPYDLQKIAMTLEKNPQYKINYTPTYYLGISRIFNEVHYNIKLQQIHRNGRVEFNLNNFNFSGYKNGSVTNGEKCSLPNFMIKRKVYQMIDDTHLDSAQKKELKKYVRVVRVSKTNLNLIPL